MDSKVILFLSDDSKLELNKEMIIQPISLITHNGESFTSQGEPIILEEYLHQDLKFIPIITEILAKNEFFSFLNEDTEVPTVYQSSNVVKIEHK